MDTTFTTQQLVAIDFVGAGDSGNLIDRLGDALVGCSSRFIPDARRGAAPDATVLEHRFEFDTSKMRNTVAHGHGCAAGFIVHVED